MRVQIHLTGTIPSRYTMQVNVVLGYLSGGVKPLGQAICLGVDCPGPWWTESLMDKPAFTRADLSDVRVIMAIIRVHVEEVLCQVLMGLIPVLDCPLSGACGHLRLLSAVLGIKCRRVGAHKMSISYPNMSSICIK
jgi:hypothetical protein